MNVRNFTGSILLYPPPYTGFKPQQRKRVGLVVRGTVKARKGMELRESGEGRGYFGGSSNAKV